MASSTGMAFSSMPVAHRNPRDTNTCDGGTSSFAATAATSIFLISRAAMRHALPFMNVPRDE